MLLLEPRLSGALVLHKVGEQLAPAPLVAHAPVDLLLDRRLVQDVLKPLVRLLRLPRGLLLLVRGGLGLIPHAPGGLRSRRGRSRHLSPRVRPDRVPGSLRLGLRRLSVPGLRGGWRGAPGR